MQPYTVLLSMKAGFNMKSIFFAGLLALTANTVFAASTTYSDFASWTDDVGGLITTDTYNSYDFTGGGNNFSYYGSGVTLGGITYSIDGDGSIYGINKNLDYDAVYHKSNYIEWESSAPSSTLTVTLASYTNAIGFNFGQFYGEAANVVVTLGNGDIFTTAGNSAYAFFGVISSTVFNKFTISGALYPSIDNLSLGPIALAPVPEPETEGLMLAGLVLLGAVARRKQ